jgi:hypothetical protein
MELVLVLQKMRIRCLGSLSIKGALTNAEFLLVVAQKVSKINMENLTILLDHDVVRVAVTDSQDESGYTVACTAQGEGLDGLVNLVTVVLTDPLVQLGGVHLHGCKPTM